MQQKTVTKVLAVLEALKNTTDGKGFTLVKPFKFAKDNHLHTNFIKYVVKAGLIHEHDSAPHTYQWSYPGVMPTFNDARKVLAVQNTAAQQYHKAKTPAPKPAEVRQHPVKPSDCFTLSSVPINVIISELKSRGYTGQIVPPPQPAISL